MIATMRDRLLAMTMAVLAMLALALAGGPAAAKSPQAWVDEFWPTAKSAGISWDVYSAALSGFTPDPDVLERASRQAEFVKPIWDYLDSAVSDSRIGEGRNQAAHYADALARIEATYGVERSVLLAIWGMESHYGSVLANPNIVKNTIRSLATLAYSGGSRARYGREQLIAALKIVQRGDISLGGMTGSWAGAMGHTQFIPTTFQAYAVDFDGDGRRDIWNSPIDALASAANYLARMGWESGKTWGYEVSLPNGFDYRLADDQDRPVGQWAELGVRRAGGGAFPRATDEARLLIPAGANGPAFLMLKNFRVIKRYNNADAYALAVGHLSDRLRGFGPFVDAWPRNERPLDRGERAELQQLLASRGLYEGAIDAKIGGGSRAAIRAYQRAAGLVADGYASLALLQRLRGG
jgi:membrane-bound lytic murein transglycosylase B